MAEEQGFTTALLGLADQRRAALLQERQRIQNEEINRANVINQLSGFDASKITNPHMRAAFEQQISDIQDYISGVGEYEDQEYNVVGFARNLRNLTASYNSMIGHNNEQVTLGRESLLTSATTTADDSRKNEMGGVGTGKRLYANNSLSTLDAADEYHNGYFEPAMYDGKYQYDENGHLLGYEVLLDENDNPIQAVDGFANPIFDQYGKPVWMYDTEAKSIYEMHAYANPSNYAGETIEVDVLSIMDMAQSTAAKNRLDFLKTTYTQQELSDLGFNNENIHRNAVGRLFEDWWTKDSKTAVDWRSKRVRKNKGGWGSYVV